MCFVKPTKVHANWFLKREIWSRWCPDVDHLVTDSQELDHLKTQAVISNKLWQEVDIPRRNSDKRAYRFAIQHTFSQMKKLCILEGSVVKLYVIMQIPPNVSATFCTDTCFQFFLTTDQLHGPPCSAEIQPTSQQDAFATHPYRRLVLDAREKNEKHEKCVRFTR